MQLFKIIITVTDLPAPVIYWYQDINILFGNKWA